MNFLFPHFHPFTQRANRSTGQPENRQTGKPARSRAGSALVIVLGLLSVLLLMGVAFSVTMRTERSGASNMRHAAMARHTLDSAIARVMSDLDVELAAHTKNGRFYGNISPTNMVVLSSANSEYSSPNVSVLSHEIARHLPSDQLAAALDAEAQWVPIYGSVRITDESDSDPTTEDPPVGRYAYVVLNNSGYLDPNTVGRSTEGRGLGLSTSEIQLGSSDGANLLGLPGTKSVGTFKNQIRKDGHYVTMRDFLHDKINAIIGNTEIKPGRGNSAMYSFSTNSFAVGSMAIDDLTPPVKVDNSYIDDPDEGGPAVRRLPKISLVDEKGKLLKPSSVTKEQAIEIAEAFELAFESTRKAAGNEYSYVLHEKFKTAKSGSLTPLGYMAMRNLMDAMDDDAFPGGTQGHDMGSASTRYDEYLEKAGVRIDWDYLPCTEPVPMLDNLIFVAGTEDLPGLSIRELKSEATDTSPSVTTAAEVRIVMSAVKCSAYFAGWKYPSNLKSKFANTKYAYRWQLNTPFGFACDECDKSIKTLLSDAVGEMNDHFTSDFSFKPKDEKIFRQETDQNFLATVLDCKFSIPISNASGEGGTGGFNKDAILQKLPKTFGFSIGATGWMVLGGANDADNGKNIVQIVPTSFSDMLAGKELDGMEIPLLFDTEKMLDNIVDGTDDYVPGCICCLDPVFGYNRDSWLPGLGYGEDPNNSAQEGFRDSKLSHRDLNAYGWAMDAGADLNPFALEYLEHPYDMVDFLDQAVIGGCSDVMWANPNIYSGNKYDLIPEAAYMFYFDPEAGSSSDYGLNRVGQLGLLPIGTYKTISLLDGFCRRSNGKFFRVPRQRVLDYFTMNVPRDEGSSGHNGEPGNPVKSAIFQSKLNLNPPRNLHWEQDADSNFWLEADPKDFNLLPITAALTDCPLVEWSSGLSAKRIEWKLAEQLAEAYAENISRTDETAREESGVTCWNSDGAVRDLSVLGRCGREWNDPKASDVDDDPSWDTLLRKEAKALTDIAREGIVRNSAGMFTARQQLFTILLKADSFTPKFGYNDAEHGTSLASVEAIAHVWRDPDPLRDADGNPVRDWQGNPIHPWVLLDMYQF